MNNHFGKNGLDETVAKLKHSGTAYAIATVVRTLASTAAKPGMKAVVLADGSFAGGWLGGGCVTAAVSKAAVVALKTKQSALICLRPEELLADADAEANNPLVKIARNGCPSKGSMDIFIEPVVPRPELVVYGSGPVALAFLKISTAFDFEVKQVSREVDDKIIGMLDNHTTDFSPSVDGNRERFVVIATQGSDDFKSLKSALTGHSSYIAFVGSRKKFASLHKKLKESGIGDNLIDNIRSPAGLDIKAILPEEIALSIMAEIIQTRRNLGAEVGVVGA